MEMTYVGAVASSRVEPFAVTVSWLPRERAYDAGPALVSGGLVVRGQLPVTRPFGGEVCPQAEISVGGTALSMPATERSDELAGSDRHAGIHRTDHNGTSPVSTTPVSTTFDSTALGTASWSPPV